MVKKWQLFILIKKFDVTIFEKNDNLIIIKKRVFKQLQNCLHKFLSLLVLQL